MSKSEKNLRNALDKLEEIVKSNGDDSKLLTEVCFSSGKERTYISDDGHLETIEKNENGECFGRLRKGLCDVFLPYGYPDSVSKDYWNYQVWDTAQAFCSTITGTLTTQAVLRGVGVGDATATPLGAAITWVLKDGTGMIGRIIFAWWKGRSLDADCKQWRFFADILNDMAIFLEFLLPVFYKISIYVLCVTSVMKSIVGVAGGATRAAITQHQALQGNMADVAAKDASQETCVNLIASFFGIFVMTMVQNNEEGLWFIFSLMTCLHILSNYYAIKALVFPYLNETRLLLLLKTYLHFDTVAPPAPVNAKEPLMFTYAPKVKTLCGFDIQMGLSLMDTVDPNMMAEDLKDLLDIFKGRKYFIVPDLSKHVLFVYLDQEATTNDTVSAYFYAVILGIALCQYNNVLLSFNKKRQLHHKMPLDRLENLMKNFPKNVAPTPFVFPMDRFVAFNEYINTEMLNFFTALNVNGWDLSQHSLPVGEYRLKPSSAEESASADKKMD